LLYGKQDGDRGERNLAAVAYRPQRQRANAEQHGTCCETCCRRKAHLISTRVGTVIHTDISGEKTARPIELDAHADTFGSGAAGGVDSAPFLGCRIPANLVRFNISALIATINVLPDMEIAAISGLNTNGYKTPAASGNAMVL